MTTTDPTAALALPEGTLVRQGPHGQELLPPAPVATGPALAPLTDHGLLRVSGADAAGFLHGQLTNDVANLGDGDANLSGYCTPKGRLIATMLVWRAGDAYWLALGRDLAEPVRKRLSMFVLRAKVRIENASEDWLALGWLGDPGRALAALGDALPPTPGRVVRVGEGFAIGLPPAGDQMPRTMFWFPADAGVAPPRALAATLPLAATSRWREAEIRAAIPRVFAGTSERFVPQMINYELVGGVSFKKGCYPGQEVVARSQYLGKLKRRMAIAHASIEAAPGTDVFATEPAQPVGTVVMSAPDGEGGFVMLVEAPSVEIEAATLRVHDQHLHIEPPPYPMPAN